MAFQKTKSLLLTALLTALAATLPSCGNSSTAPTGKPTAVATIFAYYDALRSIGGDDVNALMLLPPGVSPHDYTPSPQNKSEVMSAQLIIKNGLQLDPWIDKLAADNRKATLLAIGDGVVALHTEETSLTPAPASQKDDHDHAHETKPATKPAAKDDHDHEGHDHSHHAHDHSAGNPHVWLDPTIQILAAEKIRDSLIKIDPANRADYIARAETYINDLKKLDDDFKSATASFKNKEFVGFHSAYDYLAQRYGLKQVASISEYGTGGLNPAQIQKVVEIIKSRNIPVVFSETAFDAKQAEVVTRQTNVKLGTLQPLETYDNINDTYISLMRQNLASLEKHMKN